MADETLAVHIKSDGSASVVTDIASVEQRLAALEQAYVRSTGAAKAHGDAHKSNADAMEHGTKAAHEHADAVTNLAEHYRMAAAGLGVFGLEAEAAAVKVDALASVVRGLGRAAPEMLAIGAAIGVAAVAFSYLKESVDEAARSEREMVTIGAMLKNQSTEGWREQSKAVDEYASSLARTTTFGKGEWLQSIQAMLTAGLSFNDAIRSQSAVMELAATKSISLRDAAAELSMAYNNNLIAIHRLGLVTADEVKAGVAWETILSRIHDRLGGADAAALDTFSGKVQNLQNLTGLLKEEFGTALLPVLDAFIDAERRGVTAMKPLSDEFKAWATQHMPELQAGARGFANILVHLGQEALPLVEHGVQAAMEWLATIGHEFETGQLSVEKFAKNVKDAAREIAQLKKDLADLEASLNSANAAAADWGLAFRQGLEATYGWIMKVVEGWERLLSLTGQHLGIRDRDLPVPPGYGPGEKFGPFYVAPGGWGPGTTDGITPITPNAPTHQKPYDYMIGQTALLKGVDPAFAVTINRLEDPSQNPTIRSSTGAVGLMQVQTYDAAGGPSASGTRKVGGVTYSARDLEDPATNIKVGLDILSEALQHFGKNYELAAAAYNAGIGAVDRAHGDISLLPKETRDYVDKANAARGITSHYGSHGAEPPKTSASTHFIEGTKGGGGEGYDPPAPYEVKRDRTDPIAKDQKELKVTLDAITRSEEEYAKVVALAGDSDERAAAQLAQKKTASEGAALEIKILNSHIAEQTELQKRLTAELRDEDATRASLAAKLNAWDAAHKGIKASDIPLADKDERKQLAKDLAHAETAYARTNKYITENTAAMEANHQAAHALVPKTYEYAAALAALNAQLADQKKLFADEAETYGQSLETQKAYWKSKVDGATDAAERTKYLLKVEQAEQQSLRQNTDLERGVAAKDKAVQDELATYNASLQEQYAYFNKRFENLKIAHVDFYTEYAAIYAKLQDLHKQFVEQWQSREATWLDGIIKHTKSLKDTLRDIWSSIWDDLAKSFEQRIIHGRMFQQLNDMIATAFGMPTEFGQEQPNRGDPEGFKTRATAEAAATTAGKTHTVAEEASTASTKTRTAAETEATTATKTRTAAETEATTATRTVTSALDALTTAAQRAASSIGHGDSGVGGKGGGPFDAISGAFNPASAAGVNVDPAAIAAANATGPTFDPLAGFNTGDFGIVHDVNVTGVGGKVISGDPAVPVKAGGAGGFAGAMQGLMIAQLVTGLTGGNSTWGSVGGAIGGAYGGPIGAAVGAAIGGMFGNHKLGPNYQPDLYNPAWGQTDVNWNGDASGRFGPNTYSADPRFNVSMGGTPEYKLMEQWANSATATTDAQKALQAQIKALEAGNPNADFGVVREANNIAYLANGQQISVPDLIALEQKYQANVGTGLASSAVFELSRTYPDLNIGSLQPNGTYTPTPITVTPAASGGGAASGSPGGSDVRHAGGDVTVNVSVQGNVIGATPDDIARVIAPAVGTALGRRAQMGVGSSSGWANRSRYGAT